MSNTLSALRLSSFKSVRDADICLRDLTLIVGRNGSGKSNIFDALAVLGALGTGTILRDALDGGREGPVVRGGSQGCSPLGEDHFSIGCTAETSLGELRLDLEIQTEPTLQIRSERLWQIRTSGNRKGEPLDFLKSDAGDPKSADITARWDNGKRGTNPGVSMRTDQLLTAQVATRVPATSAAGRRVHQAAMEMLGAIASIFILDPVPNLMREYVPEKDYTLRRTSDNLSAVLRRLIEDQRTRDAILSMSRNLSEAQVSALDTVTSPLGDVMITLEERLGHTTQQVPARLMSDGTLRFLAIASALLDRPDDGSAQAQPGRLLAIEELENGLHPSQAAMLLRTLKDSAVERNVRTIATTHSPAILDSLLGSDHEGVVVCFRGEDGWTRAQQLTTFPDYFDIVGRSTLGKSATDDDLRPTKPNAVDADSVLAAIFGD